NLFSPTKPFFTRSGDSLSYIPSPGHVVDKLSVNSNHNYHHKNSQLDKDLQLSSSSVEAEVTDKLQLSSARKKKKRKKKKHSITLPVCVKSFARSRLTCVDLNALKSSSSISNSAS